MDSKYIFLIDEIFNKLKKYKARKIYLEKDDLKNFLFLLSNKSP